MPEKDLYEILMETVGAIGRMICGEKSSYDRKYPDHKTYFNSNIFADGLGKIWYGDIDFTLDEPKLKLLAKRLNKTIYLVKEHDGRFDKENRADYSKVAVAVIKP